LFHAPPIRILWIWFPRITRRISSFNGETTSFNYHTPWSVRVVFVPIANADRMDSGSDASSRARTRLRPESGSVMGSSESEWEHTARLLFTALMETQTFFVAGEEVTDARQLVEAVQKGRPILSVDKKI
tara:strand:- start:179 stop:565 length:387 start_codon:yes stop_codon:yes gene_type:complete